MRAGNRSHFYGGNMIEIRAGPKRSYFLYLILLEKNKSQNNRRGTNIYHPAAIV